MQAAKCGITRPAKVQQLADGGFVKAIKGIVDKITTQTPKDAPLGSGAASQAKDALTTRKQVLDDAERKAVGMAKGGAVRHNMKPGGKIPGKSPTPTADNIKIDATAGEFMLKKSAADVLGPKVLKALNAVGDGHPDKESQAEDKGESRAMEKAEGKKGHGAVRKMAGGGPVVDKLAEKAIREYQARNPTLNPGPSAPNYTTSPGAAAAAAKTLNPAPAAAPGYPSAPNYSTSPGAAPASNGVKFVLPPEPIAATTSPGATAAPAAAAPAQPVTVPAARVAPQSAVKFSGDPMYPNSSGPAPARPAPAAPAAAPRADAVVRGTGFTVTEPPKAPSMASRALGAVRGAAGPALMVAGAVPEQMDVASVAANPNTTKNDVLTQQAQGAGRYASAALGAATGGALGLMTGPAAPVMAPLGALAGGAYGYFAANKAIEGGRNLLGTDPRAPVDRMPAAPAVAAPAPVVPAAAAPYPETAANRTLAPPASPQAVATAVANPANPAGAVTRIGNSYSGAPGVSGDISVNGKAPRGGIVQGTGDGTFTYGGSGSGLGGGVSDQALQEARLGAIRAGDVDGVKASYAAQGQSFGPKVDPIDALLNNGRPMTTRKAAALGALQKAKADQQAVEEQRKLERDKFGLDKITSELGAKTATRLNNAEEAVLNAKTPEARDMAVKNLEALQKRSQRDLPPEEYAAIAGGTDAMGNRTDPLIYSKRTGQRVDQPIAKPAGSVAKASTKAEYDALPKGAKYIHPDGTTRTKG